MPTLLGPGSCLWPRPAGPWPGSGFGAAFKPLEGLLAARNGRLLAGTNRDIACTQSPIGAQLVAQTAENCGTQGRWVNLAS